LYSSATYNPFGELASGTYGDGITRTNTYDQLGRLTQVQDGTSGSTYLLGLGYQADGSVASANDSVNGNWSYTYDAFNRLATSTCTLNCPGSGNSEAYTYSYDQYGNRWKQHKTAGTGLEVDYMFNGNNRNTTSGFAYDSAGNLTSDGSCTPCWTYDDAGQLTSGNGATYLYDALGRRQQKTDAGGTMHDFVFDGSVPYTEFTSTGFTRQTGGFYTYANSSTYFPRTDHLGTPRVTTDYTGSVQRTETNLAFGDGFSETASPFIDFTGFADGFWDSENNADHFGAREYAKTQGRWLTPDPAGLAAVNPRNPQTWNRYAYVTNNPTTDTDPSGLVDALNGPSFGRMFGFFASGGGGVAPGAFDCEQDGVNQSCATVSTVLQGGGAGICPQMDCTNVRITTNGWVQQNSYTSNPNVFQCDGSPSNWDCYPTHWISTELGNAGDGLPSGIDCVYMQGICDVPLSGAFFQGNRQLWQNASGTANALFVATGAVIAGVPLTGEALGALAACNPGLNTSNYGHVTVYCTAWMPGNLIGIGYDPQNGLHVNVGGSVHIPLWPW
jgi:RHS repeat-associated protein